MSVPVTMPNSRPGRVHLFVCSLTRGWVDVMHHSLAVISRPQFSFGGGWACARLSGEITRDSVSLASSNRRALSCDAGMEAKTWRPFGLLKRSGRLLTTGPSSPAALNVWVADYFEAAWVDGNEKRRSKQAPTGQHKILRLAHRLPASQLHLFTPPSPPPPPTTTPTFGNSGCWQSPSRLPLAAMQPRRNLKHCLDGLPEHWDSRHCQLAILLLFPLQSGPKHQAGSWGWV